jgi:hypothetical protein
MPFFGVPIRNGLPIGLGSVAGFGVQQFDPLELFASGAEGVWYDPSDTSTLFQDPAGTTPVTAVEQPVGLMLDKSKGLVLGPELRGTGAVGVLGIATAATYNTTTGVGSVSRVDGSNQSYVQFTTTLTSTYIVTIQNTSAGNLFIRPTGFSTAVMTIAAGQTLTNYLTGSANYYVTSSGGTQSFVVVSVRELPGNHAISYNATTARPTLSARVNLLTYSEQFDNAAWTLAALNAFGSGSVANTTATLNPIGGTTADFIQESTAASTTHGVNRAVTLTAGAAQVITCSFKAATRSISIIGIDSAGGNGARAYFDLSSSGSVGTSAVLGTGTLVSTPTITPLGNGWFRCQLVAKVDPAATSATLRLSMTTADNTPTYTGDGTSGIYIWGADLRVSNIGSAVPSYQRIAAATDYDTNGFPKYLYFAGTDDGMSTPANLNLTSTDKVTVFSGVRKLSDAAIGILAELSVSRSANNGSFTFLAPSGPGANYTWSNKGTTEAAAAATAAAPTTNVVTCFGDIGGDISRISNNGVVAQTNTADQGTGNYGNYPLFIGARNNASLWLNGYLYGLTVVGAQLTTPQIESMETWTAGKTGITL